MLIRAIKHAIINGSKIEIEILGGDPRVVSSTISYLEETYKDEIKRAFEEIFGLIGSLIQINTNNSKNI